MLLGTVRRRHLADEARAQKPKKPPKLTPKKSPKPRVEKPPKPDKLAKQKRKLDENQLLENFNPDNDNSVASENMPDTSPTGAKRICNPKIIEPKTVLTGFLETEILHDEKRIQISNDDKKNLINLAYEYWEAKKRPYCDRAMEDWIKD